MDSMTNMENMVLTRTPPELPSWSAPEPAKKPVGMALKRLHTGTATTKYVYDVAFVRVDSQGSYSITASMGRTLETEEYLLDDLCNTEVKLLRAVLKALGEYASRVEQETENFRRRMRRWRWLRREWEALLVTRLIELRILSLARKDIERIMDWEARDKRGDDGAAEQAWYCGSNGSFFGQDVPVQHMVNGVHVSVAVPKLVKEVDATLDALTQKIKDLEMAEKEELLVLFDDEVPCPGPEGPQAQPDLIPPPSAIAAERFYNWCLERHGHWARKDMFKKSTCHGVYQLASLADVKSKAHEDLPRGNHGLIPELVGYTDADLRKFPWGLPAHKLYKILKAPKPEDQYYSRRVRDLLMDIEGWYFKQSEEMKEQLQGLDIRQWQYPKILLDRLNELRDITLRL
ncbi:hypothetical protein BJY04DRAFT_214469 [Aspergillus karnatakaensis]|uniref:uncharacterized protein n=1 Tax=Aspergillus karnatakaensis TaxID=1810916 RepID=UPI003CCD68DA